MGQNLIKFKFTSGETAQRVQNLNRPDDEINDLEELKRVLTYTQLF